MKNKIYTENVTLPAHWASALINSDYSGCTDSEEKAINSFLADNPQYGGCLSCSENSELRQYGDCFANQKLTDCLEYTFPINFYSTRAYEFFDGRGVRQFGEIYSIVYPAQTKESLLPWQKMGLQYSATGYGRKIPTSKMVLLLGVWRRVYCTIFSNSGTVWINFQGKEVIVDSLF